MIHFVKVKATHMSIAAIAVHCYSKGGNPSVNLELLDFERRLMFPLAFWDGRTVLITSLF